MSLREDEQGASFGGEQDWPPGGTHVFGRLKGASPRCYCSAMELVAHPVGVSAYSDDFTDKEAVAAIVRITRGNIRLIERLMMQVEHVLVANQLQVVTAEVVETARQNLIIGPN
jgi:hypothetical protein